MVLWKYREWMEGGQAWATDGSWPGSIVSLAASWIVSLLSSSASHPVLDTHVIKVWFAPLSGPCHCPWGSLFLAGASFVVDEWGVGCPLAARPGIASLSWQP